MSTLKPFDLEKAKAGEPIVTRDGRPVKFIAHVPEADPGARVIVFYCDGGDYGFRDEKGKSSETSLDLFMAPRRRTVWVNLHNSPYYRWDAWLSEKDADRHAGSDRFGGKAWPLEIEE